MKKNLRSYEIDASRIKGKALNVFHPKTISEIRSIVSKSKRIAVRGAGSGLRGGCVPQNGQDVVVDLSKLNNIGTFDRERKTIEVESGVILKDLQDYLKKYNLEFPVNILSQDIATIGGMIATDAVSDRVIKYGRTSNWIRWIEIIDCYGNLHKKGTTELSDYSGLEGITGIIVRACLNLVPIKKRTASLKKLNNLEDVIETVKKLKKDLDISMIEFLDKKTSSLLGLNNSYHLIIEYENDSGELSKERYTELIRKKDTAYQNLALEGYIRIEDPKILVNNLLEFIKWLEERNIPIFGHIGAGILHPCFNKELEKFIPDMIKLVKRMNGQISGSFGIGLIKKEYVEYNDKKILINIKKRTDPENKFNIGKVI